MDVFAVGVILFTLLTGCKPMQQDEALDLLYGATEASDYHNMHDNPRWDAVSTGAQQLVLSMLAREPKHRASAAEVRPVLPWPGVS